MAWGFLERRGESRPERPHSPKRGNSLAPFCATAFHPRGCWTPEAARASLDLRLGGAGNKPSGGYLASAEQSRPRARSGTITSKWSLLFARDFGGDSQERGRPSPPRRHLPLTVPVTQLQRPRGRCRRWKVWKPRPETIVLWELRSFLEFLEAHSEGSRGLRQGPEECERSPRRPGADEAAQPHSGRASPPRPRPPPRRPRKRLRKQSSAVSAQG
ncbi:uncharacterized protein LOC121017535 isoform X1 [Herpailurus yagouaroundi]|uniref:uncharacterized protein LOC121017535 isoform X1 n=1 Tax=Herpailurus yagouaroundi TaxID=1608482 RepID=UPI001AD7B405|nr:uncharacterized protein LOC121017535 isoform X1 [Puma yagouaroundi]